MTTIYAFVFFLQVFSKPPMVSPVTPSRYTTRHAKMVARQRASLRHIISQEFEENHLSASPMEPLEAVIHFSISHYFVKVFLVFFVFSAFMY